MMKKFYAVIVLAMVMCAYSSGQMSSADTAADLAVDAVVTVMIADDGRVDAVGSGVVVRSDGHILTPYGLVRGARSIQVRLRNGETFDNAQVVATDERRNVAIIKVNAFGLKIIPNGTTEEAQVGSNVIAVADIDGTGTKRFPASLRSVQMADSIAGAGTGYRILVFDGPAKACCSGGLLLDERGRSLGVITTTAETASGNVAVPLSSLLGMVRALPTPTGLHVQGSTPSSTPYPIAQSSVLVPQRGVTALTPKGPGSVVVKPSSVPEILSVSKTIYVRSTTDLFKPEQLVIALNERNEMADWGYTFVDDREVADLILELDHVPMTWKYTFKLYSQRLGTIVAAGNRIIWDGNVGAKYMAERVVEKIKLARGMEPRPGPAKEAEKKPDPDDKKRATDKAAKSN